MTRKADLDLDITTLLPRLGDAWHPVNPKKPKRHVGIDGGRTVGLAMSVSRKMVIVDSGPFFWALETLADLALYDSEATAQEVGPLVVHIEDPDKIGHVYSASEQQLSKGGLINMAAVRRAMKIAQDVGRVKETTRLIERWARIMEARGLVSEVRLVRPSTSKWDADTFRMFTRWEGQTNEHARDAAKLVVGL